MKIIVFHTSTYNENDLIVDAIKEDGVVSFKIRGGASATNPFIWLNNPLTVAEVEFVEPNKYKHPILLRADLISSPQNVTLSLEQVLVINVVSEIIFKMIDDDDKSALFEDILNFLTAFKKGDLDLYTLLLIFVAKAIKVSGFELEVNQCVNCGSKKDIVAFSFEEGGFICKHCLQNNVNCDLNASQMKLVRFIFTVPDFSYKPTQNIGAEDMKNLLLKTVYFINDIVGVELQSINLLLKE